MSVLTREISVSDIWEVISVSKFALTSGGYECSVFVHYREKCCAVNDARNCYYYENYKNQPTFNYLNCGTRKSYL
jgi:hypothetical protein